MAIRIFLHPSLPRRIHALPSISHSHLPDSFSILSNTNVSHNPHSPNLFAEFAATKFNLSAADIARIFKRFPSLQKLQTLQNVEAFVDMLSRHGFTHNQIAQIMRMQPSLITTSAERILKPKLQFLKDCGIEGKDVASMLVRNPSILSCSLEHTLQPNMAFLKYVFQTKDLLIKALLINPIILALNLERTLKPSVAFWEGFGVRGKELSRLLVSWPRLLLCSSLTPPQVELISKIGIATDSKMFKYVLMMVVGSRVETLESKIHKFQQCGLTSEETMELFRIAPLFFCYSKEKVWQNLNFMVNIMELPANSVLKDLNMVKCDLEKISKPRFLVWQKLKSMGGGINIKPFSVALRMKEERFMSKIVMEHPERAILYAIYQEALADISNTTKKISSKWPKLSRLGVCKPCKSMRNTAHSHCSVTKTLLLNGITTM